MLVSFLFCFVSFYFGGGGFCFVFGAFWIYFLCFVGFFGSFLGLFWILGFVLFFVHLFFCSGFFKINFLGVFSWLIL